MSKIVGIRLNHEAYNALEKRASISNKKASRLATEIVENHLKGDSLERQVEELKEITTELYEGLSMAFSLLLREKFDDDDVREFIANFFPRTKTSPRLRGILYGGER